MRSTNPLVVGIALLLGVAFVRAESVDQKMRLRGGRLHGAGGGGSSCALPNYPDASCTGVPAGTTLTAYSGPFTFTSGTTTIDSKTISSCITVTGGTVNITKSRITVSSGCDEGQAVASVAPGVLNITDSEIDCGGDPPGGYNNSHGGGRDNWTGLRLHIKGCENGLAFDGSHNSLTDSFIHDLRQCTAAEGCGAPDGSHTDGIQTGAGAGASFYTIRHNTIFSMKAGANTPESRDTYYTTSALITDPGDANGTVTENLFAGGAFTVYCPESGTSWSLTNNAFSTRYKSTVGFFGPSDACTTSGGRTVSGNFYYETGLPITLSQFLDPFVRPLVWARAMPHPMPPPMRPGR